MVITKPCNARGLPRKRENPPNLRWLAMRVLLSTNSAPAKPLNDAQMRRGLLLSR